MLLKQDIWALGCIFFGIIEKSPIIKKIITGSVPKDNLVNLFKKKYSDQNKFDYIVDLYITNKDLSKLIKSILQVSYKDRPDIYQILKSLKKIKNNLNEKKMYNLADI